MVDKTDEEMAELVDTLDFPLEDTSTYERWQKKLADELGMRYSDLLAERSWRGVQTKYECLPELGLGLEYYIRKEGTIGQYTEARFRDLITGRFLRTEIGSGLVREWWGR